MDLSDHARLRIACISNLTMFVVGLIGWRLADSTSLLADAFDMLADASGYVVAILAIDRSLRFKRASARWNGTMLMVLGVAVIAEVAHRWLVGSEPQGELMMAFATVSLIVNGCVLRMLSRYRHSSEVHLRATWIDTRADVLVNAVVLISGAVVAITSLGIVDLLAGLAVGAYVGKEGFELLIEA